MLCEQLGETEDQEGIEPQHSHHPCGLQSDRGQVRSPGYVAVPREVPGGREPEGDRNAEGDVVFGL